MRHIECQTKDKFQRIIESGDIPIVTKGCWRVGGSATVYAMGSAEISAFESATVEAYDSAAVEAFDSTKIKLRGSATVEAWDSASVTAIGSSKVFARKSSTVTAWGLASIKAYDQAKVEAHDLATVEARNSAVVLARVRAKVKAWNDSIVEARDSSIVEAYDFAKVSARWEASVKAFRNSTVSVRSKFATVEAFNWATVILHAQASVVLASPDAVLVDRIAKTVKDWAIIYGAKERDGKLVLYKWANRNGRTFENFQYVEGQMVEAPDWNPDPNIECGFGLHACASLDDADPFSEWQAGDRLAIELLVDPDDCRPPHYTDNHPTKIRFRRAFVSRMWDPEKEEER